MWTIPYKGYYVQGYCNKPECVAMKSESGYGYEWRVLCKSLQAAKIAITKHIRENEHIKEQSK